MDTQEIILLIIIILAITFFTVKTHKKSVKNEILLAENKVREYLATEGFNIHILISNQKEIKVKGLHIGVKIKAIVVKNEGIQHELILVHNSITNNIKTISEKIL